MGIGSLSSIGRWLGILSGVLITVAASSAQAPVPVSQARPIPLPPSLAADSYAIYSQLLPADEIEWGNVPRSFWLMESTTKAVPLSASCSNGGEMNPHQAIKAPPSQQQNFDELLADFDQRCHERYQLDGSSFHLKLPVRLLDEDGQKRYTRQVSGFIPPQNSIMEAPPTPEEFKGAAGMHRFTAVYFNKAHTVAMTEIGMYCGGVCGNWSWVVLQRTKEGWQVLPWKVASMIS